MTIDESALTRLLDEAAIRDADRLRRTDTGRVFTHRDVQYLWLDTSPFPGNAVELPAGF